jgi:hypothetical protein
MCPVRNTFGTGRNNYKRRKSGRDIDRGPAYKLVAGI